MSSVNDRFQHIQSQIDDLRKNLRRVEQPSTEHKEHPTDENAKTNWQKNLNTVLMTLFTGLMTLFTGFLVLTSYLQWQAAQDAIKDTHKSFEIGTRAWIVLKEAHIKPTAQDAPHHAIVQEGEGLKESRSPAVSVALVNAGRSPALHLVSVYRIDIRTTLPEDNDTGNITPSPDKSNSGVVLGPDSSNLFLGQAQLFTEAQYQSIKSGQTYFVMYGIVTYEDIFSIYHETRYCTYYNPMIERMSSCPHYNSAN